MFKVPKSDPLIVIVTSELPAGAFEGEIDEITRTTIWSARSRRHHCCSHRYLPGMTELLSSSLHSCSANCFLRLSCAPDVLLSKSSGTLKFIPQWVQTPTPGIVPSHLTTRRFRFSIQQVFHMLHINSSPVGSNGITTTSQRVVEVSTIHSHFWPQVHDQRSSSRVDHPR